MLSSADLELFLAAMRAERVTGAARALGVDRTTIGRRLDELEERVRAPLFVRVRGELRPTEAALRLRAPAERILGELRALEGTALAPEEAVRGVVRVATTEGAAADLVRRGLLELTVRHPELRIELLAGNWLASLSGGEADLALRVNAVREPNVRARRLRDMAVALHASVEYLRRRGAPASLASLAGHDLLLPGGELARMPEVRLLSRTQGARVVLRSGSLPVLVEAAAAGYGLVPIVDWWASRAGLAPALALPLPLPPRPLWLAVAPGQRDRPAVRVVADELVRLVSAR